MEFLENIKKGYSPSTFKKGNFVYYLLSFFILILFFLIPGVNPIFGFPLAAFVLYVGLNSDKINKQRQEKKILFELPRYLRELSKMIRMGISFEDGIFLLGKEGSSEVQRFFISISEKVKKGKSFSRAFFEVSKNIENPDLKRLIFSLSSTYQQGKDTTSLDRLAEDAISKHRFILKSEINKMNTLGLVFLVVSTILPTFLIIFASIGPALSEGSFDFDINLAINIFLPLLLGFFLLLLFALGENLEERKPQLYPAVILFGGFLSYFFSSISFPILLLSFIISLYFGWFSYKKEKSIEEIEDSLPELLGELSTSTKGVDISRAFQRYSSQSRGLLAEECKKIAQAIKGNLSFDKAIRGFLREYPSKEISRVFGLITRAVKSNALSVLSEEAKDLLLFREIKREKESLLSGQKYGLIFGALLIPVILSSSGGILESTLNEKISEVGIISYLMIYSAMVSTYLGWLEGRQSRTFIYLIFLTLLSVFSYFLTSGGLSVL